MPEALAPRKVVPPLMARGLGYRYSEGDGLALHDVSLQVEAGEFVVLAGRSASGKSTLLRAACGLVPHFHGGELSGTVEVAGLDAAEAGPGELARKVGYVAQDPETQVVSTTVAAEIELPLELRGEGAISRARAVEEVALALAIPHLLPRATDTLSGGELQRVALAAALVTRPGLILLDEPTSQLDPVAGDELIWLLRRLNAEWGVAVILAEHRLERCLAAADRVVAMENGTIAFDGAPRGFLTWALEADPVLATPSAYLFSLAGIEPLPTGVREARETLAGSGLAPPDHRVDEIPRISTDFVDSTKKGATAAPGRRRAALQVRDLWVELDAGEGPRDVLRGLDLEVGAGERVALMGRNGAGKSTLLRTATGLIDGSAGRIETPGGCALLGQCPADYLVRERVGEEVPGDVGRAVLAAVGLGAAVDRDPRDLSGGERQRLALAIALAGRDSEAEPVGLISLDEPTRGMDRSRKGDLSDLIRSLASRGSALLVATHDVEFATLFADRVVLLGDGVVIADGTVGEVLSGGWYFATEVARVLGLPDVVTPEQGAAALGSGCGA